MTLTWKRTTWKKEDIEESISLDKLSSEKIRADIGRSQRVIHLGWKHGKCFHYILHGGWVHVARSSIKYKFKGE